MAALRRRGNSFDPRRRAVLPPLVVQITSPLQIFRCVMWLTHRITRRGRVPRGARAVPLSPVRELPDTVPGRLSLTRPITQSDAGTPSLGSEPTTPLRVFRPGFSGTAAAPRGPPNLNLLFTPMAHALALTDADHLR